MFDAHSDDDFEPPRPPRMTEQERYEIVKRRVGISGMSNRASAKDKLWLERQASAQWVKGVRGKRALDKAGARVKPGMGFRRTA